MKYLLLILSISILAQDVCISALKNASEMDEYQIFETMIMSRNYDLINRQRERGDDQIRFLETLGISLEELHMASKEDIARKLEKFVIQIERENPSYYVFRPGELLYVGTPQQLRVLAHSATASEGLTRVPDELPKGHIFWPTVAGDRRFPIGYGRGDLVRGQSDIAHELAHWGGFIRSPEYMDSLIRVSNFRGSEAYRMLSSDEQVAIDRRLFFFTEEFAIINPSSMNLIEGLLRPLGADAATVRDASDYYKSLRASMDKTSYIGAMIDKSNQYISSSGEWELNLGGAIRDFYFRNQLNLNHNEEFVHVTLWSYRKRLELAVERFNDSSILENMSIPDALDSDLESLTMALSRLEVYLYHLQNMNISQWARDLINPDFTSESLIHRLFYQSGILDPERVPADSVSFRLANQSTVID